MSSSGPLSVISEAIASAYFGWGEPDNLLTFDEWVNENRSAIIDALRHCDNARESHIEAAIKKLCSANGSAKR